MAIRLRRVNGVDVALCAVESDEKEGDIYLHDGWHHALTNKFSLDFNKMHNIGLDFPLPVDEINEATLESQKVRDSFEVAQAWEKENNWR